MENCYIGYVRVSSYVQMKKGNSIDLQMSKISDYCKLNDLCLLDVYKDDGKSGMSIGKRDGYKEMVKYIKENKLKGIIVYSLSRLGRRLKDVIEFMDILKENNIEFVSVKENINNNDKIGSLIMNILGSINEFEVEVLRERVKDMKRNKKDNMEVYGRLGYGYDKNGKKLIINEKEKNIIKRVKNLRSRGYSWRKISNRLNEDGIKSKEGKLWYDGSLYNMMRNYM